MTEDKTITDNEVIALFMKLAESTDGKERIWKFDGREFWVDGLGYDTSWEWLMPVWYKFATTQIESLELNFPFAEHKDRISHAILYEGIGEACKLLAEGIRWYNSTQNKEQS